MSFDLQSLVEKIGIGPEEARNLLETARRKEEKRCEESYIKFAETILSNLKAKNY